MTNRKTLLFVALLWLAAAAQAQTAKDALIALPENLLAEVSASARMDLVDLYNAGLPAAVLDSFGDTICLENLTPDYLRLKSANSALQLIVLQMINDSKLYCLITTVCGPDCDSRIEFYSPSWNRLQSNHFLTPADPAPLPTDASEAFQSGILLTQWTFDPSTGALHETQQTVGSPQPLRTSSYQWTGIRFE
jgi:hypothetical protein